MNRGVFQSSPVQQMMGEGPGWWSLNNMRPPPQLASPLLASSSSSSSSSSAAASFPNQYSLPSSSFPSTPWHETQGFPESWSQLLLGGFAGEDERSRFIPFQAKLENWDHPISNQVMNVKHESSETSGYVYNPCNHEELQQLAAARSSWNHQMLPVSSPRSSCITSFSSNMLNFSNIKSEGRHPKTDHSPECNSTATGSALKKARVQASSPQPTFKVRKEKLGDRITVLHQLVSPFGKTDTASVLLEAIGYIRFLQGQIEALSSPYLGNAATGGTRNSLLNDACMKRRGACDQKDADGEPKKDLKSRGLCLVPISCTMHVGTDNVADYWSPTFGGGF